MRATSEKPQAARETASRREGGKSVRFDEGRHCRHNVVERHIRWLKQLRRVPIHRDKQASADIAFLTLAAILTWPRA